MRGVFLLALAMLPAAASLPGAGPAVVARGSIAYWTASPSAICEGTGVLTLVVQGAGGVGVAEASFANGPGDCPGPNPANAFILHGDWEHGFEGFGAANALLRVGPYAPAIEVSGCQLCANIMTTGWSGTLRVVV